MPGIKGVTYYRRSPNTAFAASARESLESVIDNFVLGVTKPSASNTGLLTDESAFETISSQVTYSTAGQTITNKKFTVAPLVRAANVTFRNCSFRTANTAGIECNHASVSNLLVERCLFRPSTPGNSSNGIFGRNFTLLRCDISGSIDCVSIVGSSSSNIDLNVNVHGNYLHDNLYTSPNPNHSDNQSHSDTIQIHYGGNNIDVFGNFMPGNIDPTIGNASEPAVTNGDGTHASGNKYYPNMANLSVLIASPVAAAAGINNLTFRKNWAGGGAAVVNWPRTDGTGISFTDNRWTRGSRLGDDFIFLMQSGQAATITGNVWDDTGVAFNDRKAG